VLGNQLQRLLVPVVAGAGFADQEAERLGGEARHKRLLALSAQQRGHEVEDGPQIRHQQPRQVLEQPGEAAKTPLNDLDVRVGGGQACDGRDCRLKVRLEALAQVVRQMRHETQQRLLRVLVALVHVFDQQLHDARTVVDHLWEAVAEGCDPPRKDAEGVGQVEFAPFEQGVAEVRKGRLELGVVENRAAAAADGFDLDLGDALREALESVVFCRFGATFGPFWRPSGTARLCSRLRHSTP
jgi:hypothetical protein